MAALECEAELSGISFIDSRLPTMLPIIPPKAYGQVLPTLAGHPHDKTGLTEVAVAFASGMR